MLEVDGSFGEGGGQVLRTALTLSVITGKPFTITAIRANRKKPGLQPQHLQAVNAAAGICKADVQGNALDSTRLVFEPGEISPGEYRFDIGTAGSTSLVLQTVFVPLSLARESSRLTIIGGTHVPWSPCFHYLKLLWLPFMQRLGFDAELGMERAGFYPKGGGEIAAEIHPAEIDAGLVLTERTELKKVHGLSAYANLERSVAVRQANQAQRLLQEQGYTPNIDIIELSSPGINTMMLILAVYERSLVCYFALGARGKPAEKVATEAVQAFNNFKKTGGVIDEYLADQLLLPLSLTAQRSEFTTPRITRHLLTNAAIIRKFIDAQIEVDGQEDKEGIVRIVGQRVR